MTASVNLTGRCAAAWRCFGTLHGVQASVHLPAKLARHGLESNTLSMSWHCRENTVERVAVQQLPAGEVVITVTGANVSDWLPLPASYALVVQGNFR